MSPALLALFCAALALAAPDSAFAAGHAQHREGGPIGTASEIWSFDVLETKAAADA